MFLVEARSSVGEHLLDTQGVSGSRPLVPIKIGSEKWEIRK